MNKQFIEKLSSIFEDNIKYIEQSDYFMPSEIIEVSQEHYNLQEKYNHYNKLLFDGKLPQMEKLGWMNKKTTKKGGHCVAIIRGDKLIPVKIEISSIWREAGTEEEIDSVLVHEMIHTHIFDTYSYRENKLEGKHGPLFMAKVKELEQKLPFKIIISQQISSEFTKKTQDVVGAKMSNKYLAVMVIYHYNKEKPVYFSTYTPKVLDNKEQLTQFIKRLHVEKIEVYMVKSPKGSLLDPPVARKLNHKFYGIKPTTMEELKDAELIATVHPNEERKQGHV